MNDRRPLARRPGFTVLEIVVALGVLSVVMVFVAQLATWALAERARADDQMAAVECTANVLETARTRAWADLTPEWAAGQQVPADLTDRLSDAVLTIRVEPEPDRTRVKRVTVELRWQLGNGVPTRTVTMVGLFADRSAGGAS